MRTLRGRGGCATRPTPSASGALSERGAPLKIPKSFSIFIPGSIAYDTTETMSGRLIILPKKSYNPWKPENVERVLRDERLERERQAQLEEADRKKQSEDRVELLKKKRKRDGSNDGGSSGRSDRGADHAVSGEDAALGHVNLFADEEKAMMEKAVAGAEGSASEAGTKRGSSSSGIMPVYLGGEEAARRRGEKATPFYLEPSFQDKSLCSGGDAGIVGTSSNAHIEEAEAIRLRKDERLKTKMDPMHDFCKHSESLTRSNAESQSVPVKGHRRKRRDSYSSSSSSSESDSSSSSSSSSSDEDNDSQRRKRKCRKRRGHDNSRRRNDSRRRSLARKDGRRRREKKRSTKKPANDDTALPSGASTLSIDEMRRRRQLREQKEAERSFMARLEDHASGHNTKYQDQYNPSLSRR